MVYYLSKNRSRKAQAKRMAPAPRIVQAAAPSLPPVAAPTTTLESAMKSAPLREYSLSNVFTPTTQPTVTLVPRERTTEAIKLATYLDQPGQIVCLHGGSQTGKTVLCECLLAERNPIVLEGKALNSLDEFWNRLSDEFRIPRSTASVAAVEQSSATQIGSGLNGGLTTPLISFGSKVEEGTEDAQVERREETSSWTPQSRRGIEDALARSGRPIIVDDFHWAEEGVRRELLEALKPVARRGTLIVLISVQESVFAPLHAMPELRNRYEVLKAPDWKPSSLRLIAKKGFAALHLAVDDVVIRQLASASRRNPLLMQKICWEYCFEQGFKRTQQSLTPGRSDEVFLEHLFRKMGEAQYRFYAATIESGAKSYKLSKKNLTFRELAFLVIADSQTAQPIGVRNLETRIGRAIGVTPSMDTVKAELKALSDDFARMGPLAPFRYDEEDETCVILAPELRLAIRYHLAQKFGR